MIMYTKFFVDITNLNKYHYHQLPFELKYTIIMFNKIIFEISNEAFSLFHNLRTLCSIGKIFERIIFFKHNFK